jgi:general secretion pathway protein C
LKGIFSKLAKKLKLRSTSALQDALEKTQNTFAKRDRFGSSGSGGGLFQKLVSMDKPKFEKYYPAVIGVAIAYFAADLATTYFRIYTIPEKAGVAVSKKQSVEGTQSIRGDYDPIAKRNIFNSDGVIPKPISGGDGDGNEIDGPAVPTTLPLNLVGTIVHVNPAKSVATIDVKSGGQKIIPYIPNDEIEGIAILLKVERKKIFIRNTRTRRLEYLEIKDDLKFKFDLTKALGPSTPSGGEVAQDGNNFTISRDTLNKYINNIGDVLQQARAVPNRDPNTGEINGFRLLFIKPDSIFSQLGLKQGDLLKSVNGSPVTSIQKAMEMYQGLKGANNIAVQFEREGKSEEFNYTVN